MITRKSFLILIAMISAILAIFSGCSRRDKSSDGRVSITLWTASNPYEMKWAQRVIEEWGRSNPGILIKAQPIPEGTSSEEILMASVIAKTTPDICTNLSPVVVEQFRQAKALLCIDDWSSLKKSVDERVPEEPLKGFTSPDGRLYQVPWKCNPALMFCNTRICASYGASPPRTYSEWLSLASKVKSSVPPVYMTQFDPSCVWHKRLFDFYALYIAASGGKTLLNERGDVEVDNKAAREVLDFLRKNFRESYSPLQPVPGQPFLDEKIAANISGPWNIAALATEAPHVKYEAHPVPVPDDYDFDTPIHTYADPKCIGIFSSTSHPDESALFVEFMCSRPMDINLVTMCNQLPYRKNLLLDGDLMTVFEKYPALKEFAKAIPNTRSLDQSPHLMEILDALSIEYVDVAVRGMRSPGEGLRRAQKRMEEIAE